MKEKRVHPGLLWVEIESAAVEIDSCLEVLTVAVTSNSSFDGHDLTVDSFGHGIRDAVSAVADDVGQTGFDRSSNLLHRSQLRVDDSAIPILKIWEASQKLLEVEKWSPEGDIVALRN